MLGQGICFIKIYSIKEGILWFSFLKVLTCEQKLQRDEIRELPKEWRGEDTVTSLIRVWCVH